MNKRNIIYRIVDVPKKTQAGFWKREYEIFKNLLKIIPDEEFWQKAFFQKVPSLAIYLMDDARLAKKALNDFYFKPPEVKNTEIKLGEKVGEDYNTVKKAKTVKGFLK